MVLSSVSSRERLPRAGERGGDRAGWREGSDQPGDGGAGVGKQRRADHLAYVIYTSGSTGLPKGVMIEQRGVCSLVKGVNYVSLTAEDKLLSTGSPSFDATTFEYWGMLLNGGQLVLCEREKLLDSEWLKKEIRSRKVTKMWFTASWCNRLAEEDITIFEGLDTILVGGEKLSEVHIGRIRERYPEMIVVNGYGPTENTTFSTAYRVEEVQPKGKSIPIGRPLSNRRAYILNEQGQLNGVGVKGELCVGGAGLARGYLNQPALTAERFIADPWDASGGGRLYRTGDLGRWLADGNIEYIGRKDQQVKIRGYRIELGEIESVLLSSGLVRQSVIVVRENTRGEKWVGGLYRGRG